MVFQLLVELVSVIYHCRLPAFRCSTLYLCCLRWIESVFVVIVLSVGLGVINYLLCLFVHQSDRYPEKNNDVRLTFLDGLSNNNGKPLVLDFGSSTATTLAGVIGEGNPFVCGLLFTIVCVGSSEVSRSMASLLGAGVRL